MDYWYLRLLSSLTLVIFLYVPSGLAQTSLGTAQSFAVLGGSTVTNTGPTAVNGNLGVSPGSAVTGFPPGTVTGGTIHAADAVALQAQNDVTTAYVTLAGTACNTDLTGQDLGGLTLTPGVYCFSSSAQLTGALTLNFQGNADAVFIFQIVSTLITASNSSVSIINGGQVCNVFWQVGSSATLGTTTRFIGNILALTSITLQTGATVEGRALARNGAVTMDSNVISRSVCAASCSSAPSLVLTAVISGPPAQIQITVQDTGSGLQAINVLTSNNATVSISTFSAGTTSPVLVTATKIDQSSGASVTLEAINVDGCSTVGDPVITELEIPESGVGRLGEEFTKIPSAESYLIIKNGNLGLTKLNVKVNDQDYGTLRLKDDQEITIDLSSLMVKKDNTIMVTGIGRPTASALLMISDLRISENGQQRTSRLFSPHILWKGEQKRSDENLDWGNRSNP